MKQFRIQLMIVTMVVFTAVSICSARSILEKKIHYVTMANKTGQAGFWAIFLGNFDCMANKSAGDDDSKVKANVNIQFISSGYMEGNGYSSKGKIEILPTFWIKNDSSERKIEVDSIDFIADRGRFVRMIDGESGSLLIDIDGQKLVAKDFLLREYKLVDYFGEKILKDTAEEQQIKAMSYTKEAIQRAMKFAPPAEK